VARLLQGTLDPGEVETIALALEILADSILLDECDVCVTAERAGLQVLTFSVYGCEQRKRIGFRP